MKTTFYAFVLSTLTHIGVVLSYYYIYLYLHPDDPGKKKFYATSAAAPGVRVGGRTIGRGIPQSNQHKSYLMHLVAEHYKTMSPLFFVQFSLIYLAFLFLFKFFPERERLKKDTINALQRTEHDARHDDDNIAAIKPKSRLAGRNRTAKPADENDDNDNEFETLSEDENEDEDETPQENNNDPDINKKDN